MNTGEDGIDVIRKLFQRKVIIENCEPATSFKNTIDSNNEQSVYALLKMRNLSSLKDAQ